MRNGEELQASARGEKSLVTFHYILSIRNSLVYFQALGVPSVSPTVIQFTLILTLHNLFFPSSLLPHTFHVDVSQLLKAIMTFDQSFPLRFYFLLLFEGFGCVPS